MILHQSIVEQTVDRDERDRFVKELIVVRLRSAGGDEVPLAMVRKRHAPLHGQDHALGGTLAPVLLVHGYGQNRYAWHLPGRSFSNYLARAGFDVFNLDLRGHGRSRHLGAHRPTDVTDYVREDVPAAVEEVQRITGGRPIYYLGHSMGGLVIPLVAALRPVQQLIFLSGGIRPPGQTTAVKLAGQPIASAIDERGRLVADHDSAIEQFYRDVEPKLAEWAVSMLRPQSPKPIREIGPETPWPELPIAAIVGTEDIWQLDQYQQTCRDLLGIEAILIPGGHSPFFAQPAELADLLIKVAKS